MSIRHIDDLFEPASIALVGASTREGSVGATVWRNLRAGSFSGALWPVNARHSKVQGDRAYSSVAELPAAPALAIVCTPPATVPGLITELGARGTRAALVLTAGLSGQEKQAMLDAARPHVLRILGPNCLGLASPALGLNASFAHVPATSGSLAFVSQSGALVTAMLDWARSRGIGFSRVVSLGEHADVDFGDMLDWLASDARTRAILLYVESLTAPRKFMSAARAAARNKPVLLVKAGRSGAGQRAAASHTGALAGSDAVIDAAVRRAGMLRVDTLQDLFVAAETLALFKAPLHASSGRGEAPVTIVTNGGGAGVLAADAAAAAGIRLAQPAPELIATLDTALPPNWSHGNPVDIIGDAPVERYVHTLTSLLAERDAGTLLFMHAPTAIVPASEIAKALVPLVRAHPGRLVSCWLGDAAVREARQEFHAAGIPTYDTPEQAVHALHMVQTYRRNQEQLLEAPAAVAPGAAAPPLEHDKVRALVDKVLGSGRQWLTEGEAKALLAACGIPVVPTRTVAPTALAAAAGAAIVGFPVVLKIVSPQITHKSDVGGVVLNLESGTEVAASASAMLERVAQRVPGAEVTGFALQPMIKRAQALELIAGTHVDPLFGPVILFGAGGTRVEVVADSAIALPPLNEPLARALVARTRVAKLLAGWRDVPPANAAALHGVLIALSQLLADEPRIAELDINPLLADSDGVIALDARVRVDAAAPGGAARFAVRPYPAELVEQWTWQPRESEARELTLRPIRPEDEAQHLEFLERVSPEDIRMRIFYSRRSIERTELARLTQIDYEREMAFIATAPRLEPTGDGASADAAEGSTEGTLEGDETLAVVRAITDPDNHDAEFGILVRSDLKGGGLGRKLMDKLIEYLKGRRTQRLVCTVLRENERMLELTAALGMIEDAEQPEPGTVRLSMPLL